MNVQTVMGEKTSREFSFLSNGGCKFRYVSWHSQRHAAGMMITHYLPKVAAG
jgi:hypothetical protein